MKKMKKIVSLLLTVVMVMAMTVVASAGEIVINSKGDIGKKHEYSAYQIFAGTLAEDGKTLTDITWGSGVKGTELLDALKDIIDSPYKECESAEDVADKLKSFTNDSAEIDLFAKYVGEHLTDNEENIKTSNEGTISGLDNGYYFVKDTTTIADGKTDALSKFIVQVVGDSQVTVTVKADAPSITKKIVEGDKRVDQNTASLGTDVTYELTSKVPDMDGYNKYYFIMHDKLSKGLTYKAVDSIEIGEENPPVTLTSDQFEVTTTKVTKDGVETGETAVEIVFKDFLNTWKSYAGKKITVKMTATVNENAVIGNSGNPNEVYLEYSNNPNFEYGGDDKPNQDEPTGVTPTDKVITYVTGIHITKTDTDGTTKLAGAVFKIEGTGVKWVKVKGQKFVATTDESATDVYYKLADGTYTKTAPTTDTQDKYDSAGTKYVLEECDELRKSEETNVDMIVVTDANGVANFEGLGAGEYTITEIQPPVGYNKLPNDGKIVVQIDAYNVKMVDGIKTSTKLVFEGEEVKTGVETIEWQSKKSGAITDTSATVSEDGTVNFDVVNKKGAELPSTGGIGTTIFYVLGAILVIGAGLVLVTKKRMGAEK